MAFSVGPPSKLTEETYLLQPSVVNATDSESREEVQSIHGHTSQYAETKLSKVLKLCCVDYFFNTAVPFLLSFSGMMHDYSLLALLTEEFNLSLHCVT